MTHGWNAERRTFVQYFGTDALDAANLIMPLVFFISPNDPRMSGTLNRTIAELVSDSLVHRYEIGRGAGDGLTGREGTFNMCTFWLVEALTRAGRVEEARFIFEKMLTYANHLGLYAEETGPSGEALGNSESCVRVWAAAALARVAPERPDVIPARVAGARDGIAFVRRLAVWPLGRLGPRHPGIEVAVPNLRELLNDNDLSVRAEALVALENLAGKGAPPAELKSLSGRR